LMMTKVISVTVTLIRFRVTMLIILA